MQFVLRSIFRSDSADNPGFLQENTVAVRVAGLEFKTQEYHLIWEYIDRFSREHGHCPDIVTLKNHFEKIDNNPDVLNQIEVIKTLKPVYKGDFKKRLELKIDEQRKEKLQVILKEGNEISFNGMEIRDGKNKKIIKGPLDAIRYVVNKTAEINKPVSGVLKEGDTITPKDVAEFSADYDRRRDDPNFGRGYACGLQQMDETLNGAKKGQMWTHAAFTGHLKSTLGMNWVYYQAVYKNENSMYFSLEMPYDQCVRIIYAMHSMHEKFAGPRMDLGIQEDPDSHVGLTYSKIRDGKLTPKEEKFMKDFVLKDLADPKNEYGKIMIRGFNTDKMAFTIGDIKTESETSYRNTPFGFMIVDHALLIDSVNRHPNTTERANEVVRDLKKLSEIFNRGEGMAVLTLFQISREGVKRADKSGGIYSLYDLSYANEIERSSDVVTATYLNESLRTQGRVLFQCLKTRDDASFKPFYSRIEWPCRRLLTCYDTYDAEKGQPEVTASNFESLF